MNGIRQLQRNEVIPYHLLLLADETIEAINKYINDSELYIFEQDNRIKAIYVLQIEDRMNIEIKNIAVEEVSQGQGVGKLLLRDAASRAKARGFKTITIGTGDALTMQLELYQREGFKIFGIRKDFFIDNYSEPIYENGIQLKHMVMLKKKLQ